MGCRFIKGRLHPKMKILSSFTHPQVVANLNEFLSSVEHKGKYFEERLERLTRTSKYLTFCSAEERNSFRFATI